MFKNKLLRYSSLTLAISPVITISCTSNNISVQSKLENDLRELVDWVDINKLAEASIENLDTIATGKWGLFGNSDAVKLNQTKIPTLKYESGHCFWLTPLDKKIGEGASYTLRLRVTQGKELLPMAEEDIIIFTTHEIYVEIIS